jgi:hypothetical protein
MLKYFYWLAPATEDEMPVGVMWLGQRVHTALEYWYGYDADPLKVLAVVYENAQEGRDDAVCKALRKEYDLALLMVEGYVQWVRETGADEGLTVVSTERDVRVAGPHGVDLRARLDMRVRRDNDGATLFIDHKTVGDFVHASATLEIDGQMRFYSLVDRLEAGKLGGRRTAGGLYNMLRRSMRTTRATPPFYHREEVRYNEEILRATWTKVAMIIGEIVDARRALDAGVDHRAVAFPSPSRECAWRCQFAKICPLMDDGSRWQDMASAVYARADPYGYYLPSELPELLVLRKEVTA